MFFFTFSLFIVSLFSFKAFTQDGVLYSGVVSAKREMMWESVLLTSSQCLNNPVAKEKKVALCDDPTLFTEVVDQHKELEAHCQSAGGSLKLSTKQRLEQVPDATKRIVACTVSCIKETSYQCMSSEEKGKLPPMEVELDKDIPSKLLIPDARSAATDEIQVNSDNASNFTVELSNKR